ncbi:hypothetical protein [Halosimplex salinum]|uniref:hypothetical protein n=1 Tax=Halosimplex salinum TaxID=1710538 RepID=UPI0013DE42E3|nr:hypothetical protein [Halosimplex salinum]
MVSFREPVLDWAKETFGVKVLNEMKEVAEKQGEKVFDTEYTVADYEADLDYHENKMAEAEQKFENYNEIRKDALEDAENSSSLTRKRHLAKARRLRKRATKHVKLFVAHLEKFERKLDEVTAYETNAVSADENARVDLDQTAENVTEALVENPEETENLERQHADKALENTLDELSLDDKVGREEEALRQMEQEDISAEEVGLENDVDSFLNSELNGDLTEEAAAEEEDDEVELNW